MEKRLIPTVLDRDPFHGGYLKDRARLRWFLTLAALPKFAVPELPRHTPLFSKFVAIPPRNPDGNIHMGDTRCQSVGNFDNLGLNARFVQFKRLNLRKLIELARHLQGDGCRSNTENNENWTC